MNSKQAHKEAAKLSKSNGPQFVVWVFDEGRAVYSAEQARVYASFLQVEAAYVGGVQVSQEVAA